MSDATFTFMPEGVALVTVDADGAIVDADVAAISLLVDECADLRQQLAATQQEAAAAQAREQPLSRVVEFLRVIENVIEAVCACRTDKRGETLARTSLVCSQAVRRIWLHTTQLHSDIELLAVTDHAALDAMLAEKDVEIAAGQARERELQKRVGNDLLDGTGCLWCRGDNGSGYLDGEYWHKDDCPFDEQPSHAALDAALAEERETRATLAREWVNNKVLCPDGDAIYEYVSGSPDHGSALAEARRAGAEGAIEIVKICTSAAICAIDASDDVKIGLHKVVKIMVEEIRALPLEAK